MNFLLPILLFLMGLVLVIKGGDLFVDAARRASELSGLPKAVVGATVVSIATTGPELLVSVLAAGKGNSALAAGNALGSVASNLGLILGLALLFAPAAANKDMREKLALMLYTAALLYLCLHDRVLSLPESLLLILFFTVFMAGNFIKKKEPKPPRPPFTKKEAGLLIVKFFPGLFGLLLGSRMLVDNGTALAYCFHIPEEVVGVVMVGMGTSLPELITAITALRKHEAMLSLGNVIGANIIDLTLILPLCTLTAGAKPVGEQAVLLHLPALLLLCTLAVLPVLRKQSFSRWQGAALMGLYALYLGIVCFGGGGR